MHQSVLNITLRFLAETAAYRGKDWRCYTLSNLIFKQR